MKLPPYMMDRAGYCYAATAQLACDKDLTPWHGKVTPTGFAIPHSAPSPPWQGRTVVCIASGPSLTVEDCERAREAGLPTVATNDTWRRAAFAEVVYAADPGWWQQHAHEITTGAARWSASAAAAEEFDLHLHITHTNALNSGARAMEFAASQGASRILLLGYDCSIEAGTHWHGDHTRTNNPDPAAVNNWHRQFEEVARVLREQGVAVVNCSRKTALKAFPVGELAAELGSENTRFV